MWLTQAREGRVQGGAEGGRHRVRLPDGGAIDAAPSRAMRERGVPVLEGDAVLLRPRDGGFEIVMRRPAGDGPTAPLILPVVDPSVEYLLSPGDPKWLHPYLPYLYDWYDDFDEDLPMWRRLAAEAGGPILELACGTGRIVSELARAGHRVTGVDISRPMLDRAAEKLAGEPASLRARIDWIHADMSRWEDERRFPLAFIACNSLHYMGSTEGGAPDDLRRRAIGTLFRHVAPGGLGVISNVADGERAAPVERFPTPRLLRTARADVNPNTGLFTAEYMGLFTDTDTGRRYDGPWRFLEVGPDGTRRLFEFAPPPEDPEALSVPDRPPALTRDETAAMMREAGFAEVEMRSPPDLGPIGAGDRVTVFLGRKPA